MAERDAITLIDSPDDEVFLQNCAVYCEIDCCGFNALDLSVSQVRTVVAKIGIESAQRALVTLRSQGHKIGDHIGLVRFRGYFEPAQETRQKYEEACAALERVIAEVELSGSDDANPHPPK